MHPTKPTLVQRGLAIYSLGEGKSLFLMPNPQGFVMTSTATSPLARVLQSMNRRVVTFDPPGAFHSSRQPKLGLEEMLDCSEEVLDALGVREPVDVVAHSQGTLAALGLALERPHRVRCLVLIGTVEGGMRATWRARGMPWCWSPFDHRFWHGLMIPPAGLVTLHLLHDDSHTLSWNAEQEPRLMLEPKP